MDVMAQCDCEKVLDVRRLSVLSAVQEGSDIIWSLLQINLCDFRCERCPRRFTIFFPIIPIITPLIASCNWSCPYEFTGRKYSWITLHLDIIQSHLLLSREYSRFKSMCETVCVCVCVCVCVYVCVCDYQMLGSGPGGPEGVGHTKSLYLHLLCGLHRHSHLHTNTQTGWTVWFKKSVP